MIRDIGEIQALATKYSKPQLARMAQMGLIDPTKAVMAGMMIDRITKSNMQPPQATVADEALMPVQMMNQPKPDMQAMPASPMMRPQMPPTQTPSTQMSPTQMPVAPAGLGGLPATPQPNAGVAALPSGITEMAGGGIVAFDDGGEVPGYAGAEESVVRAKPGYGRSFEFLPVYVPPKTSPPPAPPLASDAGEVFSNIGTATYNLGRSVLDPVSDFFAQPTSRGSVLRVDPNTGKPVSFGEYMRLQEAERNAAALPQANTILSNVASNQPPLADQSTQFVAATAPAADNRAATRGGRSRNTRTNTRQTNRAVDTTQQASPNANQTTPTTYWNDPTTVAKQGDVSAQVEKTVTEPTVTEQPSGIASIVPKRPDPLTIDPNLGKFTVTPLPVPKEKGIKDFLLEQREAAKEAGVNNDIYKDLMRDLEGKKGKLGERKKEAFGNAIMQTGLALLGARRGQEFAVLGEAGQKSLQNLVLANEKIRETEDKIDDARRSLLLSENDYKRTLSDKALENVQKHRDKIENLENRNIENQNIANQEIAKIQVQKFGKQVDLRGQDIQGYGYDLSAQTQLGVEKSRRTGALEVAEKQMQSHLEGIREQSRSHLEGIKLQGNNQLGLAHLQGYYQLAAERLRIAGMNRPGETERMMAEHDRILKTQGPEAAENYIRLKERISGAGKPQNTFSYEEAMKIVAAKPSNINASPQELARQARELMATAQTTQPPPSNAPAVGTIQEWDGKKWRFKGGANTKDNWEQVR
jgi:hypothetical protein